MNNRRQLLHILFLLPLVFLFGPNAYPQGRDPSRDLSVSWSSRREPDPGSIFGSLTNKSINNYPCVRIQFDLFTRFDLRKPGEQSKYLGVFTVGVKGISPRTVRNFDQPLPYPAGIGLRSVSECGQSDSVPGDMKILSFTITPANIVAGQTATLQWQTENSETVQVGMQNPEVLRDQRAERILKPRSVESSGSLQVTPSQTTTYALKATKGSFSSYARSVTVTVTNPVPGDMKILSFTITPANIVAGQTATLQWQTENSETVQVGMQNPEVLRDQRAERILKPRNVESSGSLQVTPSQTTTYALKATKGSLSSYARSVTVTVTNPPPPLPPPQGVCTIFGRVSNDQRDYATTIGIYRLDDLRRAVLTRRVGPGGEFSISNVPVGEYDVIPRGSYPNSRMSIGPNPRARRVTCQPAGSHPVYFRIQSNEG